MRPTASADFATELTETMVSPVSATAINLALMKAPQDAMGEIIERTSRLSTAILRRSGVLGDTGPGTRRASYFTRVHLRSMARAISGSNLCTLPGLTLR